MPSILSKKITDMPAWAIVMLILLLGGPGTVNLLSGGILNLQGAERDHAALEQRINALESNMNKIVGIIEKNNDIAKDQITDIKLNQERIASINQRLSEILREIRSLRDKR